MIKDKWIMKNLIILIFLWVATSIDFFLMNFELKYYEGDVFVNTMVIDLLNLFRQLKQVKSLHI